MRSSSKKLTACEGKPPADGARRAEGECRRRCSGRRPATGWSATSISDSRLRDLGMNMVGHDDDARWRELLLRQRGRDGVADAPAAEGAVRIAAERRLRRGRARRRAADRPREAADGLVQGRRAAGPGPAGEHAERGEGEGAPARSAPAFPDVAAIGLPPRPSP